MVDTHPVSRGADPLRWDPLVVLEDPYPTYRRLRDEAPLYHDDQRDIWAFTRYDDVQSAARDWATYASGASGGNDLDNGAELFQPAGDLAGVDPPTHERIRAVLHPAFKPGESGRASSPSFARPSSDSSTGSPTAARPISLESLPARSPPRWSAAGSGSRARITPI